MTLFIINDGPYGSERSDNGLRLALSLAKSEPEINVYLIGDGVQCAADGQETPTGFYNIGRIIKGLLKHGAKIYS